MASGAPNAVCVLEWHVHASAAVLSTTRGFYIIIVCKLYRTLLLNEVLHLGHF